MQFDGLVSSPSKVFPIPVGLAEAARSWSAVLCMRLDPLVASYWLTDSTGVCMGRLAIINTEVCAPSSRLSNSACSFFAFTLPIRVVPLNVMCSSR